MPKYENIIVTRDKKLPGLMTITLNRPEKLNALNVALHDDLQDALHKLETDFETRVVILTGAGRAFSAGAQIGDRRDSTPANDIDRRARASIGGKTSDMLDRLEQVTIGAVNGLAVGGAVVFLSCLDMRIAVGGRLVLDPGGRARPAADVAGAAAPDARAWPRPHEGAGDGLRALHGAAGRALGLREPHLPRRPGDARSAQARRAPALDGPAVAGEHEERVLARWRT